MPRYPYITSGWLYPAAEKASIALDTPAWLALQWRAQLVPGETGCDGNNGATGGTDGKAVWRGQSNRVGSQ
jgi:hypothetical protein